jgi:hypothetical protein
VTGRYLSRDLRMKFPINPEDFIVEDSVIRTGDDKPLIRYTSLHTPVLEDSCVV